MSRLLLLFLDGVGIGPADRAVNPFFRADIPALSRALGGTPPSLDRPSIEGPGARAFPIDARLGVEGIPQSGTGQIALLTGRNAPSLHGGHFGPWPPVKLRPLLESENILRRVAEGGARVAFANAYPRDYPGTRSSRRIAAPTLAAQSAGLLTRHHESLARGEAVASEIVNDGWRDFLGHDEVPLITPEEAGVNLARITATADLTFFAHYHTDLVGHRGEMSAAESALERVDRFLAGVLSEAEGELGILVVSDHGNLEDVRAGHTRNPALGMALGPRGADLSPPVRLTGVPATIRSFLSLTAAAD